MSRKPLAYALVFALALVGCGDKSAPAATTTSGTPESTPAAAPAPGAVKELKIDDVKVGKGESADTGDALCMLYTGKLMNGTVFDSTQKRDNKPFTLILGTGQVIEGWEKGLIGMKVGGERNLTIPSSMAYGAQGKDPIPPNSDLMFNVKLLAIVKKGEERTIQQKDLKAGSGPAVKVGDTVTINYVAKLPTGEVGDSTFEWHKPITFVVGKNQVLDGLDAGVVGMKAGGKRELIIPPALGPQSPTQKIPFNSVLTFTVDLVKIG